MKIRRFGRRQFLASLGAASLVPRATWSSTATGSDRRIEVRLVPTVGINDREALEAPICAETAALVEPALHPRGGVSPLDELAMTLSNRFGSAYSETYLGTKYVQVWVGDHWELWCIETTSLGLSFGSEGTVDVEVEETLLLS